MTPDAAAPKMALAIEAWMDWRFMSLDPGSRRDAGWLYQKWSPHLKSRFALGGCLAEIFSRDARSGMEYLVRALMEEAYADIHNKPYRSPTRFTSEMLIAGLDTTSQVYERGPREEARS